MAGRIQDRLERRRQYEAAEPLDPVEEEPDDLTAELDEDEGERRPKKKKAPAKAKARAVKPAKPAARMRIVWAVVNDAFKTVATFEYNQKQAALARAAELTAKGKGTHFVQKTKEAMPENAPGLGAMITRTPITPPPTAKIETPIAAEEDEDLLEEEDEEAGEEDLDEDE